MTENKGRPVATSGTQTARPANTSGTQTTRRSGRISLAIPILIIGSDSEGRVFSEQTQTVILSLHGAGIVSRYKLMAEQELILREKATNRETEIRVVGEIGQQEGKYTYGVEFVDETLDFWQMEFPAAPAREDRRAALALECNGCGGVVELANGEFEYDICAIHGGLARYCEECGLLTVWRQPQEVRRTGRRVESARKMELEPEPVAEMEAAPEREPELMTLAEAMKARDRRGKVRAKVNFFACVRTEEFGEDIVTCIDMSRGGVSFRSRNCYVEGMKLQIAVPYSPEAREAPAIFVRGRIANAKEMAGGGMRRCGVEFLRG